MAALPKPDVAQLRYTIALGDRDDIWPQLTLEEARAGYEMGFRFSIFDEAKGEFNVSIPYAVLRDPAAGTLTFIQD